MRSLWQSEKSPVGYPAASGRRVVDTIVIGGGITGVTTAFNLARAGIQVVLLEARGLGEGDTGRSTGNLYSTVSGGLAAVAKKWDESVAREVVDLRTAAIDTIERRVIQYGIDCQFRRCPLFLTVSRDGENPGKHAEKLEAEFEASRTAGLRAERVDEAAGLPFVMQAGMRLEGQAQFNPYRYVTGLARAAVDLGAQIHENCLVRQFDASTGTVTTDLAEFRAQNLVFATHTPLGVNLLQAEMEPFLEYGVAGVLPDSAQLPGSCWVQNDSVSLRGYEFGGEHFLVAVGSKHKTGEGAEGEGYYQRLRDYLGKRFAVTQFPCKWSAQQFKSADLLPYIGHGGHDNVWVATGFSADGLTWGAFAGTLIAEQIQGLEARGGSLFNPRRFTPLKSAAQWAKENISVTRHFVKDYLTPARLKHLEQVAPGEGRIVSLDGDRLAVYRSPDNELSVLSPVCPHMKCMVAWNAAETTWDCPCHGSRFAVDGSVLAGPALEPLARRED